MPPAEVGPRKLRWIWIPLRVLLVTFLAALLSFALLLLLGIVGLTVSAWLRGVHPDMTLAYRHFAFPAAASIGVIALLAAVAVELRYFRRHRLDQSEDDGPFSMGTQTSPRPRSGSRYRSPR